LTPQWHSSLDRMLPDRGQDGVTIELHGAKRVNID
jgi:hypothetical protein